MPELFADTLKRDGRPWWPVVLLGGTYDGVKYEIVSRNPGWTGGPPPIQWLWLDADTKQIGRGTGEPTVRFNGRFSRAELYHLRDPDKRPLVYVHESIQGPRVPTRELIHEDEPTGEQVVDG